MIRRLLDLLLGRPAERRAYRDGWDAGPDALNPYRDPALRREWRHGVADAHAWAERAW